jgi:hypothetical protein
MNILVALTQGLPIGTNLALLQFLWMLVSGALLPQRGAIFPALQATGLSDQATRRAWAAFRRGVWQTAVLLRLWQEQIEGLPGWQVHRHEGYRAITVDVTAFLATGLAKLPEQTLPSGGQPGAAGGDFRHDWGSGSHRWSTPGLPAGF